MDTGPGWRLGTVWGDFLQGEGSLAGMAWTRSGMQHAWNREDQVAGTVRKYRDNQGVTGTKQGACSVARMEQGA